MPRREYPDRAAIERFYTGLIETPSDKTYVVDPALKHAIKITSFFAKTSSGTCTILLQQGGSNVAVAVVSSSTGEYASVFANQDAAAAASVTFTISSTSSAADLQFRIGYEQEIDLDE